MTITEIHDGLLEARRTLLAFQERFETNGPLSQRAGRCHVSLTVLQTHVSKLLDPQGFARVDNPALEDSQNGAGS